MHGSQRYSYSSGVRRDPPLLLPLYLPPLPSLPFQTIRFIRKSCTRNGRSRERENTCAHVCMGTKSMEVFEDAVPPPSFETFRQIVGRKYRYTPPCIYFTSFFTRSGKKGNSKVFRSDWRKISRGNFEFEDGSVKNLDNLKLIGNKGILFEIFSL